MVTPAKRQKVDTTEEFIVISKSLDLHSRVGIKKDVENLWWEDVNPINSIDESNSSITFRYGVANNLMMHPCLSFIKCTFKIVKANGNSVNKSDHVFPVKNLSSAYWEGIDVKINNYIVENNSGLYPYRANLEKELLYEKSVKEDVLTIADYYHEDVSWDVAKPVIHLNEYFGVINNPDLGTDDTEKKERTKTVIQHAYRFLKLDKEDINPKPYIKRFKKSRKSFTLIDTIHGDLFCQSRYLPPGTDLEVTFHKINNTKFCLLKKTDGDNDPNYKIKLESFVFQVCLSQVNQGVVNGMVSTTETKLPYNIPIRRVEIQYHTHAAGLRDFSKTTSFLKEGDNLPRRIFTAFVFASALNGHFEKDPFHYHDINATMVYLRVGGQIKPLSPLICDDRTHATEILDKRGDNVTDFVRCLYTSVGTLFNNSSLGITTDNWSRGNAIWGWDLTSGDCQDVFSRPDRKHIEFYCKIHSPDTNNNYAQIVLAEYDSEYTIDKERVVTVEKTKLNG